MSESSENVHMRSTKNTFLTFLFGSLLAGCGGGGPENGVQLCATSTETRRCPDGYVCQADNHCWVEGTGPDGSSDGGIQDAPRDPLGDSLGDRPQDMPGDF